MCLTPCSVATLFSILRATSVSSCAGLAPGRLAVTLTVGRSMSGKFWIFMRLEAEHAGQAQHHEQHHRRDRIADAPRGDVDHGGSSRLLRGRAPVTGAARRRDGTGRAVGTAGVATTRTRSPSARKPPPLATTRVVGVEPVDHLDAVADTPADVDLGLLHLAGRHRP